MIVEAHQTPGTVHEGVKKVLERLVHSDYWRGMKRDVQPQLAPCPTCEIFYSPTKMQLEKLNPIPTNYRAEMLAIAMFGGKASLRETLPFYIET